MAKFSKKLSKTDVRKRLAVPTRSLSSLPSFDGAHAVYFQAADERGEVWTFKCSIRKRRHPKPVLSKDWLAFVDSKGLKAGDMIEFYKETNEAATAHAYKVRAERQIKIFGVVFGYAPITAISHDSSDVSPI
ncbi:hypothetical protein POPTR_015G015800v4 [Populus trichocarpa]|jgi:hypothetical protein|uniref:Uncharacterized protein n=1 Tax=Populus trichocarpa TaxID=3694 RepID=A0A2K1XGJ3_POPTR|nr:hypothetical protein POPTR_015G015800v4 [Populus trichocarpa]